LAEERQIFSKNPKFKNIPAVNFASLYLSPLSECVKEQVLWIESLLGYCDINGIEIRVPRMAGPSLRNLAYPEGKFGFELRMEDNPSFASAPYCGCFKRVFEAMDRLSYILSEYGSLFPFQILNDVRLQKKFRVIDRVRGRIEDEDQSFLDLYADPLVESFRNLSRIKPNLEPTENERLSLEIDKLLSSKDFGQNMRYFEAHREGGDLSRFLFPLRRWEIYPLLEFLPENQRLRTIRKIKTQGLVYLKHFMSQFAGSSSALTSSLQVRKIKQSLRIAVAEWAYRINLLPVFEKFEKELCLQYLLPCNHQVEADKKLSKFGDS
jgi:hypothetical protein